MNDPLSPFDGPAWPKWFAYVALVGLAVGLLAVQQILAMALAK